MKTPINLGVINLYNDGMRQSDIARKLGVRANFVHRTVRRARKLGMEVAERPVAGQSYYRRSKLLGGARLGTWADTINRLPEDVVVWLGSNTPPGATISELVSAILIDVYIDEKGDNPRG